VGGVADRRSRGLDEMVGVITVVGLEFPRLSGRE